MPQQLQEVVINTAGLSHLSLIFVPLSACLCTPHLVHTCHVTAAGALSIVEVGHKRVKFAAGAYVGTLEAPEQMAVFLYYLNVRAGFWFVLV